jgi:hypothetical protein
MNKKELEFEDYDFKLENITEETDEMVKLRVGCGLLIMLTILTVIALVSILIGPF